MIAVRFSCASVSPALLHCVSGLSFTLSLSTSCLSAKGFLFSVVTVLCIPFHVTTFALLSSPAWDIRAKYVEISAECETGEGTWLCFFLFLLAEVPLVLMDAVGLATEDQVAPVSCQGCERRDGCSTHFLLTIWDHRGWVEH